MNENGMVIKIHKISNATKLWFGDNGIKHRNEILEMVKKEKERKYLEIDLKNIEVTDTSYAREAFVNLINLISMDIERPQILFSNVAEHVAENMNLSFKEHKKFALITEQDGSWKIIGKYSDQIVETVRVLMQLKEARATELQKKLGGQVELSALNNRLTSLYDMCIVHRSSSSQQSGGKEYLYKLVL